MNTIDKKLRERIYLNILLENKPELSAALIQESENPDFILNINDIKIGIEIIRIFINTIISNVPLQAIESEMRIITEMSKNIYMNYSGLPNIEVSIAYNPQFLTSKTIRKDLSAKLAEIIKNNIPSNNEHVSINYNSEPYPQLPNEVSSIIIGNFEVLKNSHWNHTRSGYIQDEFIDCLQKTIFSKNIKLNEYLKSCDKCILLVVADNSDASSFFDISQQTKNHIYSSNFNHIYYLETLDKKVVSLRIRPE